VRLTRRGITVLAVAALLSVSGWWGRYPLPVALGAAALGVVLAALLTTSRPPTVSTGRSIHPDLVERGRPARARLRVRNTGARRLVGLLATDALGRDARVLPLGDLAPDAETTRDYDLPTGSRGRLTVGPLVIERTDPFGLARSRVTSADRATVRVHPRQWPAQPPAGGRRRMVHEEGTVDETRRGSADLRDVREYVPGDEVRHLHWKATARTGRLMVRDLSDPRRSRLTVLVDTRAGILTAADFDEAVDVAASLLSASARAGHPGRLITSAGREVAVDGPYAIRPMLDALSELRQDRSTADPALVPAQARRAGGDLVVITAGPHPGLPGAMLMLVGPASGSDEATSRRVIRAADAEQAVRRWNEANR
jgi:uncharacterized protein (DUF58 family)